MRKPPQRKINREEAKRCRRELELVFGDKTTSKKDNTQRGLGAGNTGILKREESQ